MIHPRNQCHKCSNRGDGPCPFPIHPLPQNERYKITFSQEHATTKSGCSQSKILSASRHPRVYPRDGKKDLLGSALPPFSLRGGRCEEDAEKASKSHEKTSEDPTTFTLALSSEWVLFSPFIRGAIHILKGTDLSLSLPRPNRDQKADGVFPSLPPSRSPSPPRSPSSRRRTPHPPPKLLICTRLFLVFRIGRPGGDVL